MRRAPSLSARLSNSVSSRNAGFTLVELLVAVAVLSLILLVVAMVEQETGSMIGTTSRSMETTELCLAALDRIDSSLAGMVTTATATAVVVKNNGGVNDGLVLVTNGRVRSRTSTIQVGSSTGIRMGVMGYSVINTNDADISGKPKVPMLNWGNGTVTWLSSQTANAQYNNSLPLTALAGAVTDIAAIVTSNGTPPTTPSMLQFQSLSKGIFRFEICYLLSDGTMKSATATVPPLNKYFLSTATPAPAATFNPSNYQYALAFNAADSNSATGLYVRALIIGVAGIDSTTQKTLTQTQLTNLPSALAKPTDGQTPLQAWDISTTSTATSTALSAYPKNVLQNIRFFQRYIYVN